MQAYDIRVDDKVVGRKYFNVYRIKSKEDLVCGIEISKTSLMRMLMCGKVTHKNLIDSSLYSVKKVLTHIRNRIYNIYEIGY